MPRDSLRSSGGSRWALWRWVCDSEEATRSKKCEAPGERCSARDARRSENIGPATEADGTLQSPGEEASPLPLQTPSVWALNGHLSRLSLQDTADSVKTPDFPRG